MARHAPHVEQLPDLVSTFVEAEFAENRTRSDTVARMRAYRIELRRPIEQFIRFAEPKGEDSSGVIEPIFFGSAEGFFDALKEERGLREPTVRLYRGHLVAFEHYLIAEGLCSMAEVTVMHLDGFIEATRARLCAKAMPAVCCALRHLLRWLYREQRVSQDLGAAVEAPHAYRLSTIPRSISWMEVKATLAVIDRETATGLRDYAMLLLIVMYGLRAKEVAALTLDDLDWRHERLNVPQRKAGHSTSYPLSPMAGDALVAYLAGGRPQTVERRVFLTAHAPRKAVDHNVVSGRARHYLRTAGIETNRPGSHTLRHSCAQRLVDAGFSLKVIGDYLGHGAPMSTEVYTKVDVEALRQVALGNGEVVL